MSKRREKINFKLFIESDLGKKIMPVIEKYTNNDENISFIKKNGEKYNMKVEIEYKQDKTVETVSFGYDIDGYFKRWYSLSFPFHDFVDIPPSFLETKIEKLRF